MSQYLHRWSAIVILAVTLQSLPAIEAPGLWTAEVYNHPDDADRIAVRFSLAMPSGWHAYWMEPGDSGMPPEITWPPDSGALLMAWPLPERYRDGSGITLVHHDQLALWWSIPRSSLGSHPLPLQLSWLACQEACVPGSQELGLSAARDLNRPMPAPIERELQQAWLRHHDHAWPAQLSDGVLRVQIPATVADLDPASAMLLGGSGVWNHAIPATLVDDDLALPLLNQPITTNNLTLHVRAGDRQLVLRLDLTANPGE